MRKFVFGLLLLAASAGTCFADSQGSATGGTAGTQSTGAGCIDQAPTLSTGQQATLSCGSDGSLKVSATITPSGTQDVNITQTGGVTQLRGAGATGTGSERVTAAQDATTIAGSAPGTAGTASANVISVQGIASGTNLPVSQATASSLNATVVGTGTFAVQSTQAPSSASTAGVASVQSASVETGHVIKGSAGNLYSFNVSADSTLSAVAWAVMIFNSTTVPAAGAVTPVKCYLAPIGTTSISGDFNNPVYFATGVSMAVSTGQTCFTKTDSAHGFISANVQ